MKLIIEKATEIGFCFGVRRAIDMLEKAAQENGNLETLGAVVHNDQVLHKLDRKGISVIKDMKDIKSGVVAISSHGVSPEVESELRARKVKVIDTTCPSVRRVQMAARRLTESGFFVVIFGDSQHPEVKGILGYAQGKGLATLDLKPFQNGTDIPGRLGIIAQTTQIQESYTAFIKGMLDLAFTGDSEIHILNTLCNNTRKRQSVCLDLAKRVDLMLVVGGKSSANTRRLFELCSGVADTYLIEKAEDINPDWLAGKKQVGITSGASTSEETVDEVVRYLENIDS
jgi:4-hydroxy-3-methylbut-2-en-1-yl diphosphate reductase